MAKLDRKDVKIFSSNPNHATQVSAFLTGKNETPDYTLDPNAIQNTYYPKGWFGDGENNLPQATDMNGVMFAESYKNAYLYQAGIPEWSATQEYFENSYCRVNGVLYSSLIDNNINNNPSTDDGTKWKEIALEPYTGENIGTAEGVYAGKTINNELQFKTLAVTGNGNISSSDDTITIAIGGGGTGDVYWGAIDGTLSNQSDLQQALNLKQNAIGYTPEDVANKVTTIRTDTVATDTAYPSEKATRTAIDNAITSANTYTDNALTNLATNAFVLYANSWTNIRTGTLTTTAPTGTGTTHTVNSISSFMYENIANFTYTTTQETTFNNTFTYDVLVPIRNTTINNWFFKFKLTITHADVNAGNPTTLFDYTSSDLYAVSGSINIEIKQDLLGVNAITYPIGSTIEFNIQAMAGEEPTPHNFDLLVYDETNPIVISRNKGINKNLVTAFNTQALGTEQNQEYFNTYINNSLAGKQDAISQLTFDTNKVTILNAFDITLDDTNSNQAYLYMTPKGKLNILQPLQAYIGSASHIVTGIYTGLLQLDVLDSNSGVIGLRDSIEPNSGVNLGSASNPFNETYCDYVETAQIKNIHTAIDFIEFLNDSTTGHYINYNAGTNSSNYGTHVFRSGEGVKFAIFGDMVKSYVNLLPETNNIDLGSGSSAFSKTYTTDIYCSSIHNLNATGAYLQVGHNYMSPSAADTYQLGYQRRFSYVYSAHFDQGSDINKKSNIKNYDENVLEKIKQITPITYNYMEEEERTLGISAQELKEIEPLIVNTQITETKDGKEEDLGIDLYSLSVFAIKAIKELNAKVEALEARIEELEKNKEGELKK